MLRSKWLVLVLAMALSLGVASIAYAADDSVSFDIVIDNPYVAWDNGFLGIAVAAEPGVARQYGDHNTVTVASLTPCSITVTGEWAGANVKDIALNIKNAAVRNEVDRRHLRHVQVVARGGEAN